MTTSFEPVADDDPRLLEASRAYLAEIEAGRSPNHQEYLARYPELRDALSECLEGIDLAQSLKPMAPEATPVMTEFPTSPLGDFQIVREIGRGGMGVVYEAVQLSLGRRVALKVLPFAAALDAKHLQRFKTEAQAAAQLHHTNIVPVYAVGCERGMHFYAMQLIEGRSLADVIEELRDSAASAAKAIPRGRTTAVPATQPTHIHSGVTLHSGRNKDSFRSAARFGAQIADALEYAHESGVVHRDVKPANLLLDGKGGVWITDFGLAQVGKDVTLTQTGDLVGTLRYMSPEQAAARRTTVDHRTDIYSLGVTLYELLTLHPIFSGTDRVSLLHQILNEDPRPLRQWDKTIPVELETILLKCLAKNADERYATAGELAADLRRFLDERPILARRPTVIDHTRKWMRRHPSFVGAAVLLLVCGTIGLSITTAIVAREHTATKDAWKQEAQRAKEAKDAFTREAQRAAEAEVRFQLARRAADEMIQLAEEELSDNPFQEGLRKRLLESALSYYQEFIVQRSEDPDAQAALGLTRDHVQRILADLEMLQADRNNYLLKSPGVLDDLKATEKQRTRLVEWLTGADDRRRDLFREYRQLPHDERHERFVENARINEAELSSILSLKQLQRLRQIALQWQGPNALRELSVANTLKLTSEQKERIREIDDEYSGRGRFGHGPPQSPDNKDQRFKAAMEQVHEVLTTEQLDRWQQLAGKPYTGSMSMPNRQAPRSGRPD